MMVEQKTKQTDDKDFVWKFRIPELSPVFTEVNSGKFKKIAEPDVYTCDEKYNDLAQRYISEGIIEVYTEPEEPLRAPGKRYTIEDGRFMAYENKMQANGNWKEYGRPITDNYYIVIDTDIEFDDGMVKIHRYRGRVIVDNGANEFKFDEDGKSFVSNQEMGRVLSDIGGAKIIFGDNAKEVRAAMQSTSEFESRKVSQEFGWHGKVYQSQSSMMLSGVVRGEDSNVDLSLIPIARHLDILLISDKDFKRVGEHIVSDLLNVHERYPIDCLFGFTFLSPIASKIVESDDFDGGRIGMWLVGTSGCGKSYTALLFQNFFGNFKGKNPVFGWLGTPLSIQTGGYYFKDALFMVDDFKIAHFSQSAIGQAIMVLQNYTDGTSRTRLNTGMDLNENKPIRGSLLITGEDVIEDVASVMARYHVVEMDKDYINREVGANTKKYRKFYNGFMGRYIAWLLKDPKIVSKIVDRIEGKKSQFVGDRTSSNIDRVAQSFAYNLVGFDLFCRFLEENNFISLEKHIEMVKIHKNNLFLHIDKNVMDVKEANASEIFINTIKDLINSGAAQIHRVGEDKPIAYGRNIEYIGFDDFDEYIYFFSTNVWKVVMNATGTGKGLSNSKTNVRNELVKRGIMVPHVKKDGTVVKTFNKVFYGNTVATWRILKSALGYEEEVVLNEDTEGW